MAIPQLNAWCRYKSKVPFSTSELRTAMGNLKARAPFLPWGIRVLILSRDLVALKTISEQSDQWPTSQAHSFPMPQFPHLRVLSPGYHQGKMWHGKHSLAQTGQTLGTVREYFPPYPSPNLYPNQAHFYTVGPSVHVLICKSMLAEAWRT